MTDYSDQLANNRSPRVFNRIRQAADHGPASFLNVFLATRNLSEHELSNSRFTKCSFDKVQFGVLKDVEFAECKFTACQFHEGMNESAPALDNLLFYDCSFAHTGFENCNLVDVQFAKSQFATPPKFEGAKAKGVIRIVGCGDWRAFRSLPDLDLRVGWDTSLSSDLKTTVNWLPTWAHIRALQQIPFLQTSLVGLLLLTTQIVLIELFVRVAQQPEATCKILQQLVVNELGQNAELFSIKQRLDHWCSLLSTNRLTGAAIVAVGESMVMFVVLFFATIIHKIRGPSEIFDYSRNQWQIEQARPSLFYEILARRNPISLTAAIGLYAASLALFCYLFAFKVIFILRAL
jgi:hypothetical protein